VADPKSPGWRYSCNANGVVLAGTWVGIQGCQWANCCLNQILARINYKQKRGLDHHSLIKETVDLWRSVYDGNEETGTWFRLEVESMVEQFIVTEDSNILTLMQSTVRYCLLRLNMTAGSTMADSEQNNAIKANVHRTNHGGSDPEDDAWSTRIIYQSAWL
jgi:hypothetical protein